MLSPEQVEQIADHLERNIDSAIEPSMMDYQAAYSVLEHIAAYIDAAMEALRDEHEDLCA